MIVVDHHMAEPKLPKAIAVVNPNRLMILSDLGNLAAVGVVFLYLSHLLGNFAKWVGFQKRQNLIYFNG